ncbi:MAG: hypothetical protein NTW01_07600 [Gammaproteobacteria bacterium]|uniref:hypothetical protein n=1 Tax=Nevskia sp. TaxID=1929292 RepID=UPI0040366457|nr:hypothetical protein [Gammaproteobacteria bacterium]
MQREAKTVSDDLDQVPAERCAALKGLSVGKACVRFPAPERMDFALIDRLLAASRDSPC